MRWVKRHQGFYELEGTDYGVVSSFANAKVDRDVGVTAAGRQVTVEQGDLLGGTVEWAVTRGTRGDFQAGDNLDWFDTMREARADAERRAARDE